MKSTLHASLPTSCGLQATPHSSGWISLKLIPLIRQKCAPGTFGFCTVQITSYSLNKFKVFSAKLLGKVITTIIPLNSKVIPIT